MADTLNPIKGASKPAWIVALVAGGGVAIYFGWKKLHQPKTTAATTTTGYGYGSAYGSPAGYGYGVSPIYGYGLGGAGGWPYYGYGGGYGYSGNQAPTTNAQWFQDALSFLTQNGTSSGTAEVALAKYLQGAPVTADQATIIQIAEGAIGPPPQNGPNGYPPNINTSGSGGGGNAQNPVTGLRVTNEGTTGSDISWNPSSGAKSYQVTATKGQVSMRGATSARIENISGGHDRGDQSTVSVLAEPAADHARAAQIVVHTRRA